MEISSHFKRKNKLKKNSPFFSVLSRQKISKKHLRRKSNLLNLKLTSVFILCIFSLYKGKSVYDSLNLTEIFLLPQHQPSQIFIHQTGPSLLDDKEILKITQIASDFVALQSNINLELLSKKVQDLCNISSVFAFKHPTNNIQITIKKRSPLFAIKHGPNIIYASTEGELYVDKLDQNFTELPIVSGLLDDIDILPHASKNKRIDVSIETQSLINDIQTLLEITSEHQIIFKEINYKKYRGFSIFMNPDNIELSLGFSPFESKLEKYLKISENLKIKGSRAQKIELDYEGKAFVTEAIPIKQ